MTKYYIQDKQKLDNSLKIQQYSQTLILTRCVHIIMVAIVHSYICTYVVVYLSLCKQAFVVLLYYKEDNPGAAS